MILSILNVVYFQNHIKREVSSDEQIYQTGCLVTMEGWFNTNLYYIGGAALGVAIVQVCEIFM